MENKDIKKIKFSIIIWTIVAILIPIFAFIFAGDYAIRMSLPLWYKGFN